MNLAQLTSIVLLLRGEEGDIRFDDVVQEPITTEALADVWLQADEWKTAANQLERILNDELARRLDSEDKSTYEVGEYLVFRGYRSTSEKCVNEDGFWNATLIEAQSDPEYIRKIFNPNTVRKSAIRPSHRDTFFVKEAPPKAEKQAVYAPLSKIEEAKQKREMSA